MSEQIIDIDGEDFHYLEVEELPLLWKMKLAGDRWKNGRCPYCGSALADIDFPIVHKHCLGSCGRNYV